MELVRQGIQSIEKYISMIGVMDIADILIVALLMYKLFQLVTKSNAMRVLMGITFLLAIMGGAEFLHLRTLGWLLNSFLQVGLLAVVIVFQPEIRKFLEQVGSSKITDMLSDSPEGNWEHAIMQIVEAAGALSWSRDGALIVLERRVQLGDILKTGTIINSDVSAELLKNIFYPKAPLHDGAVIIQGARVAGAGCMLPLTTSTSLSKDLGMRHRAGIGMSENSDAIVVIVSEETGSISVAIGGMLKRHLAPETLDKLLHSELIREDENKGGGSIFNRIKRKKS